MKKLIAFMILMPGLVFADLYRCEPLNRMSPLQQWTLLKSYEIGEPFDMGYSLAAIAWQESVAGLYPININDPSFGVHHILLDSAMKRSGMKDTSFNRNIMASSLLDIEVSAEYAIMELQYWKKYHKGNWNRIWASYNAGHRYQLGVDYANKIKHKIKLFKSCVINPDQPL